MPVGDPFLGTLYIRELGRRSAFQFRVYGAIASGDCGGKKTELRIDVSRKYFLHEAVLLVL